MSGLVAVPSGFVSGEQPYPFTGVPGGADDVGLPDTVGQVGQDRGVELVAGFLRGPFGAVTGGDGGEQTRRRFAVHTPIMPRGLALKPGRLTWPTRLA